MQRAFGANDADLITHLFLQATSVRPESKPEDVRNENSVLAALHGIEPRDELEGLLAVQMIAIHNLAMAFLKQASLDAQTTPGIDLNVNRGTKLLRTFTALLEALHRTSHAERKMPHARRSQHRPADSRRTDQFEAFALEAWPVFGRNRSYAGSRAEAG